ncbi:MAG: TonB-dependent receptor [Pseudohongiellaceae bacterium]
MTQRFTRRLIQSSALSLAISMTGHILAQSPVGSGGNSVVFPADHFDQYAPVSVNDMINRIPGINQALGGGGGNRRGLGSGANEILINGQRMAGKSNEGRDQLSRIAADQVDYIEIIRGTSDDVAVRGGDQTLNIVLLDSLSRRSINAELNMDRYHDGTLDPGGNVAVSGQDGAFNYLFSAEAEPRYNNRVRNEQSYNSDHVLTETRYEEDIRDETRFEFSTNLGYQFTHDVFQLNALYGFRNPPSEIDRLITDYTGSQAEIFRESEERDFERSNWEVGGDYEHTFNNGSLYRFLFIVNDSEGESVRERYQEFSGSRNKDLYLYDYSRDRERIARTSYIWNFTDSQGLEIGVEGAQTIRDSDLRMGLDTAQGTPSDLTGGLIPVTIANADSRVEEMRYETFVMHSWQLNDRMTLESGFIHETSEITQTGDVFNDRSFDFLRPKMDYRFDITPAMQLRATVEKDVSQLSFSDFSTSTDNSDDDQNTQAGNPDIRQEQAWLYELNLEYRLPNNVGVLNSRVFYRDIEDYIDRVDVTVDPQDPLSARGNIGDAERYGIDLDVSTRLGFIGLSDALLTTGLAVSDSRVTDPFLGIERRTSNNGRGFARLGFRHDLPALGMNYGFNYGHPLNGGSGRESIDIIDIEVDRNEPQLNLFLEKQAFNDLTFRFDIQNALDNPNCRERTRFDGLTVDGVVDEIEKSCSRNGQKFALKVRTTF